MNEECTTRVIFRKWHKTQDIIAILLDCAANPGYVVCYEHVGQHGEGKYFAIMEGTSPATPDEYAPLARELTQIGYRLLVRKRRSIQGVRHKDTYAARGTLAVHRS